MPKEITLKKVSNIALEKKAAEDGSCTFAVFDTSIPTRPLVFVSTKSNDSKLGKLPGWTMVTPGEKDQIKRFSVRLTRAELFEQLKGAYPRSTVRWIA